MMIFVYGENAHFVRNKVEGLKQAFREKFDPSGMNLVEFPLPGGEVEIGQVGQATQSPPFLSEKRMVVVRGLASKLTKADADPWIAVLERLSDATILIFEDHESVKKFEKRILYTTFATREGAHRYAYSAVDVNGATEFAQKQVAQRQMRITQQQINRLVAMVGNDVMQIEQELEKLAAYANGEPVTDEAMRELVRASVTDQMFALMDAISNKQTYIALGLLRDQREAGSTDFHLFAMLVRQLRLLTAARDMLDHNPRATKQELAGALGVHPFVAEKSLAQAKRFTSPALRTLHKEASLGDIAMKSGQMRAEIAVDRLVAKLVTS